MPLVARVMLAFEIRAAVAENGVSGCSDSHQTLRDDLSNGSQGTAGTAGHLEKSAEQKSRLFHFFLMNYQVKMCKFGSQVCQQSP